MEDKCFWCGVSLEAVETNLDHFLPRFSYGRDHDTNLIKSCESCNKKKSKNIWIKTKDGVMIFKRPRRFIKRVNDGKRKFFVISHVYESPPLRKYRKIDCVSQFGIEADNEQVTKLIERFYE